MNSPQQIPERATGESILKPRPLGGDKDVIRLQNLQRKAAPMRGTEPESFEQAFKAKTGVEKLGPQVPVALPAVDQPQNTVEPLPKPATPVAAASVVVEPLPQPTQPTGDGEADITAPPAQPAGPAPTEPSSVEQLQQRAQEGPKRKLHEPYTTVSHRWPFYQDRSSSEGDLKIDMYAPTLEDVKQGKALQKEITHIREIVAEVAQTVPELQRQQVVDPDGTQRPENDSEYTKRIAKMFENRARFIGDYEGTGDALFVAMREKLPRDIMQWTPYLQAARAMRYMELDKENQEIIKFNQQLEKDLGWSGMRVQVGLAGGLVDVSEMMPNYDEKGKRQEMPYRDMMSGALVYEYLMDIPYEKRADGTTMTFREKLKELTDKREQAGTVKEFKKLTDELRIYNARKEFFERALEVMHKRASSGNPFTEPEDFFQREAYNKIRELNDAAKTPDLLGKLFDHYFKVHPEIPEKRRLELLNRYKKEFSQVSPGDRLPDFMIYAHKGIDWMERKMEIVKGRKKLHEVPSKISSEDFRQGGTYKEWGGHEKDREKIVLKPKPKEEEGAMPTAPPEEKKEGKEGKEGLDGVKPAPTGKEGPPSTPETVELQKEIEFGAVGVKHRIGEGGKGEREVMEERTREMAWQQQTEQQEIWDSKNPLNFIPRFWKFTLSKTGTYGKEKSYAQKVMAESGLNIHHVPYEFMQKVDELANQRLKDKRKFLRPLGWLKDTVQELAYHEKGIHGERIQVLKELRQAAYDEVDPNNPNAIQTGDPLVAEYRKVLKNDYQAGELVASAVTSEFHEQMVRTKAGEKRAEEAIPVSGSARQYLINGIINPLLQSGMVRKDGTVDEIVLLKAQKKAREFFTSKEFIEWYDEQLKSNDPKVVEAAKSLKLSLSYGTDLIDTVLRHILPEVLKAQEHVASVFNLDSYLEQVVLKTRLGTMESGQKEGIEEGFYQKLAGREINEGTVKKLYDRVRSSSTSLVPRDVLNQSADMAELLRGITYIPRSHLAAALGVGAFIASRGAGAVANIPAPLIGGALVGGALRAAEESSQFQREYEYYNVEDALGYKRPEKAKRARQMENIMQHRRKMEDDLTAKIRERLDKKDQKSLLELMGYVADIEARMEIMDEKGIGLLGCNNPQSYQVELRNLQVAVAQARKGLMDYFGSNAQALNEIQQNHLHIATVPTGRDATDFMIEELRNQQKELLLRGTGIKTDYQEALGVVTIDKKQSYEAREWAKKKAKAWRMGVSFVGVAGGSIGGYMLLNNDITKEVIKNVIQGINNNVPGLHGFLEGIGWIKVSSKLNPVDHPAIASLSGPPSKIPQGTEWTPLGGGKYNLVVSADKSHILYENAEFDSAGKLIGGISRDSANLHINNLAEILKSITTPDKVDRTILDGLTNSGYARAGDYDFRVDANGVLKIKNWVTNTPIDTANEMIFKGGKLIYKAPDQNTISDAFLNVFKKLGVPISEKDFTAPRYTDVQWQDILNNRGFGRYDNFAGKVQWTPSISAPPAQAFTGIGEVKNPEASGIGWLMDISTNAKEGLFSASRMLKNSFEGTIINDHQVRLSTGEIFEMHANTAGVPFKIGDKIIYSANGGNILWPQDQNLVDRWMQLKGGDPSVKKFFKYIISNPGQKDGLMVDVGANGEFKVPDSLKDVVYDSAGNLKAHVSLAYIDPAFVNPHDALAGTAGLPFKLAGYGPPEQISLDLVRIIKGGVTNQYGPNISWTEQVPESIRKVMKDFEVPFFFDWARRPLEAPELVYKKEIPEAVIVRPKYTGPTISYTGTPKPGTTTPPKTDEAAERKKLEQHVADLKKPATNEELAELKQLREKAKKNKLAEKDEERLDELEAKEYQRFKQDNKNEAERDIKKEAVDLRQKLTTLQQQVEKEHNPKRKKSLENEIKKTQGTFETKWGISLEEFEEALKDKGKKLPEVLEKVLDHRYKQDQQAKNDLTPLEAAAKLQKIRNQIAQAEAALAKPQKTEEKKGEEKSELMQMYETIMKQYVMLIQASEAERIAKVLGITKDEAGALKKLPAEKIEEKIRDRVINIAAKQEVVGEHDKEFDEIEKSVIDQLSAEEKTTYGNFMMVTHLIQIEPVMSAKIKEELLSAFEKAHPDYKKFAEDEQNKLWQEFIKDKELVEGIRDEVLKKYGLSAKQVDELTAKQTEIMEKGGAIASRVHEAFYTKFAAEIQEVEEKLRKEIEGKAQPPPTTTAKKDGTKPDEAEAKIEIPKPISEIDLSPAKGAITLRTLELDEKDYVLVTVKGNDIIISKELKDWTEKQKQEINAVVEAYKIIPQMSPDGKLVILHTPTGEKFEVDREHLRGAVRGTIADYPNRWASVEVIHPLTEATRVINIPVVTKDERLIILKVKGDAYGILRNITLTDEEKKARAFNRIYLERGGNILRDGDTEYHKETVTVNGESYEVSLASDYGGNPDFRPIDEDYSMSFSGNFGTEAFNFWGVLDGMGGASAGELASKFVGSIIQKVLKHELTGDKLKELKIDTKNITEADVQRLFAYVEKRIAEESGKPQSQFNNRSLHDLIASSDGGTTLSGVIRIGKNFYSVNCGDSRTYEQANGQLSQLTKDHSLVQSLINGGGLKLEDAKNYPSRNYILRSLPTNKQNQIEVHQITLQPDGSFLIVCDGIPDAYDDKYTANPTVLNNSLNEALRQEYPALYFVKQAFNGNGALEKGKKLEDNVSAIIIKRKK